MMATYLVNGARARFCIYACSESADQPITFSRNFIKLLSTLLLIDLSHKLPAIITDMTTQVAKLSGYPDFIADACLINEYKPGTQLSLHQDKNEVDFTAPITSLLFGISARFKLAGKQRDDQAKTHLLERADMLDLRGKSQLNFHGILPVKDAYLSLLGPRRINLTLRKAS